MRLNTQRNQVTLRDDMEFLCVEGISVQDILDRYLTDNERFIVMVSSGSVNGFISEKDWAFPVPSRCDIRIVSLPRGGGDSNPLQVIAMIGITAASMFVPGMIGLTGFMAYATSAAIMIGGSLLLNMFFGVKLPGSSNDNIDNIYSVNDSVNAVRIGSPFPEHFGKRIIYPTLLQNNYTVNIDNDQFVYMYGIVGVGEHEVHDVYISNTLMSTYEEAEYRIIPPGKTLLPDGRYLESIPEIVTNVVWNTAEISGQEITPEGLSVVVSGRGTKVYDIEYDIQFQALLKISDSGSNKSTSVTVIAEARLVDDDAHPISDWFTIDSKKYTYASSSALRFSRKCPAPLGPGRYEFKISRTDETSIDNKVRDLANIMSVKGYGGLHSDYGNVTCFEAKIKATERLSGDVVNKINIVATRKLPIVTVDGFELGPDLKPVLKPTTSIVDAIAYFVTSENGGRQPNEFIRFSTLYGVKQRIDSLGHWFNWSFTSQGSVMDACKMASQCSRSVPYLPGGQFCLVRDEYQEFPNMTYTREEYGDSLSIDHAFPDQSSPTCVRVNYVNESTWSDDFVTYFDGRGSEDRPYEVELNGCQSRQQAYDHAAYLFNDMFNNRSTIEITTGLKGHLPSIFKKIAISAENIDWGQSGKIVAIDGEFIWLSEPVRHSGSVKLLVTLEDGTMGGPYTVSSTSNPYKVIGDIGNVLTLKENGSDASTYLLGPYTESFMYMRLMSIQPQSRGSIRLTGTLIDDSTYDDPGSVYDKPTNIVPPSVLYAVAIAETATENQYTVSWSGSGELFKLEIDNGSGYTLVADLLSANNFNIITVEDTFSVKVTPYVNNIIQPGAAVVATNYVVGAPTNVEFEIYPSKINFTWDAITNATGYRISILDGGEEVDYEFTDTNGFIITTDELNTIGGPFPSFEARISAIVGGDLGQPAVVLVDAPKPPKPDTPKYEYTFANSVVVSWKSSASATGYSLHMGSSEDFVPSNDTLVYEGNATTATVQADLSGFYSLFFKVAYTDGYYLNPEDLVFSDSLWITGASSDFELWLDVDQVLLDNQQVYII